MKNSLLALLSASLESGPPLYSDIGRAREARGLVEGIYNGFTGPA
jgi:hypothetical protein